jgi:hypothetical protein
LEEIAEIVDDGRDAGRGGGFRRLATNGFTAGPSPPLGGTGGGRDPGSLGAPIVGFGADPVGGLGREASESERYDDDSRLAPVSTPPPRLRNFGIPPAKRPPSCGAAATPESPPSLAPGLPSLLLLNRFADGTGGAKPPGGLGMLGTEGAPPIAGALGLLSVATNGADRSFVTAFFSRGAPLVISANRALCLVLVPRKRTESAAERTYSVLGSALCWLSRLTAPRRWWRWRRRPSHAWRRGGWWRRRRRHLVSRER